MGSGRWFYVQSMGYLYRLSRKNWELFLESTASPHEGVRLNATEFLGKHIGRVHNITDLSQADAQDMLDEFRDMKKM